LFDPGAARVLPSAMPDLGRIRDVFDGQMGKAVLVTGHVDQAGSPEQARALSQERARAVAAVLRAQVLPAGTTIVAHGCGEGHPSLPAHNQRVEVFFFRHRVAPAPADACPPGGCPEYPRWVAHAEPAIDITSAPEVVVLIVDELGLPLRHARVQIQCADGTRQDLSADRLGKVRPSVASGSSFDVTVSHVHEGGSTDALVTRSGRHFPAQAGRPREAP
jgi:hypothetical protein